MKNNISLEEKIENITNDVVEMVPGIVAQSMLRSMAITTAQYIVKHPEEFGLKKKGFNMKAIHYFALIIILLVIFILNAGGIL